ncbi:filamentous hemagglutinin [Luteibacter sp. 1214]|nr:filamentous hemagglutinin [Luteibacter sp. 1214]
MQQVGGPIVRYAYNDPDPNHQPPNIDPSQVVSAEEIQRARTYCQGAGYTDNRCTGFQSGDGIPTRFQATYTDTLLSYERLSRASAEGRMVAGGNITLSGSVTNDKSTVAAGSNLVINGAGQSALGAGDTNVGGEIIRNIAWNPTGTVRTVSEYGVGWESLVHDPRRWEPNGFKIYGNGSRTSTIALGDGQRPAWIGIDPGQGLVSRMTAGGTLEFHGQTIENTTVGADGNPISGVQLGANSGGSNVSGTGAGHVGAAGGNVDLGGVGGLGNAPDANSVGAVGTTSGDTRNAGPRPGSQSVGSPDAPAGQIRLPTSGLYTTHPGSASSYLIETDPRFASQAGFLGSDYLMDRLGFNGESTMKRLGDGFYEQRMVLDQITSLTGRRYLTDNTDAMAQYRALMDAGVSASGEFQLSVGIALTASQMASLTQDIVWMVSQEVNGEKVLVPVVYLSAAHAQEVAQNGAILSGKTVILDASGTLTNTGTIAASENASLKAGTLLNGGNLSAGGNLSVTAAQDILNAGSIKGGNVSLTAGNDILSGADIGRVDLGGLKLGDAIAPVDAARLGLASGGSISATGNLSASAGRDLTQGAVPVSAGGDLSLSAKRDLSLTATSVKAGGDAQLVAGRDLSLNAIGQTTAVRGGKQNSESTVHTVTTIDAGGNAVLAAGRDVVSEGAKVKAGDQVAISAGRDVVLNAITDTQRSESYTKDGKKAVQTHTMDQTLTGTSLDGSNGVIVSAGHDINATAATITSETGGVALAAKNDVNLNAGQELHNWEQQTKSVKSGTMSSTTKKAYDATVDSLAVGTLISGDSVTVAAGNDITTQGAQIGATNDLVMAAGNNLTIGTAETTHSETHDKTVSKSGLMSGGGFSVMIGGSKEQTGYEENDSTPTGSVIGSTDGKVTLTAGNTVHITGSDVLSKEGTTIVGKDVTIDAAVATADTRQTYKKQTAGITLGLTGGAVSAIQGAYGAAHRAGEVKDDRLKALYAAQSAQYLFSDGAGRGMGLSGDGMDSIASLGGAADAYDNAGGGAAGAQAAGQATGISLRVGIGASSASSETKTHEERAYGSNIRSNGDVTIAATGGDLNVIGSNIDGKNVALAAANNLTLLSQAEDHSSKSTNRNGSGEIGFSIGSQTGIYISASAGMGKAVGNGTTHAETVVNASDNLTLISGNDTTIKGAQLKGDSVLANVVGNLLIQSEQDTDDYASKQQQVGASVTFGYGGSFSYSQSKVNSHYDSVNEVSGIGAGKGGFDITVGGNTHLVGGVIASSADPSRNILDTGSLTWDSIHNEASYSASSFGVGGGSGGFSPTGLSVPQSDKSSSDTQSSIAGGKIITRDQATDLASLQRDGSLDAQGLKPIYDEEKVRANQELGNLAGQVGMTAVGDVAAYMFKHATTTEDQAKWADGGQNKVLLHGLVGAASVALGGSDALGGGLGAAGSEAASKAMAEFLVSQSIDPDQPEGRQLLAAASAALGSALGGGSGAASALNGSLYNRELHVDEQSAIVNLARSKGYSEEEVQAIACVIVSCVNGRGLVQATVLTDTGIHYTVAGQQLVDQYNDVLAQMSDGRKAEIAAELKATGLFEYGPLAAAEDAWADINGTKRLEGLGQATNSFVNALLVSKLCQFGGAACGASAVNIAQQSDSFSAGVSTWWTGQSYQTLQYGMWKDAGLSDAAAQNAQALTDTITAVAAGRLAMGTAPLPRTQDVPQKASPIAGAVDAEAGGYSEYAQYQKADGSWNWPANMGFADKPISNTIAVGTRLDRYGDTAGSFLSPVGTTYEQRALAPGTRANPYSEYEVIKPLPVIQGEIAPAFGQSGGGVQMLPNLPGKVNVQWLLDNGYLRKVK